MSCDYLFFPSAPDNAKSAAVRLRFVLEFLVLHIYNIIMALSCYSSCFGSYAAPDSTSWCNLANFLDFLSSSVKSVLEICSFLPDSI